MSYEFYIDQFFVEHLLTGFLLLSLTAAVQKKHRGLGRLAAGSLLNGAIAASCVCAGIPGWYFAGMAAAGTTVFWEGSWRQLGQDMEALLLVTACFGGVWEALLTLLHLPAPPAGLMAAFLLQGACRWVENRRTKLEGRVFVTLQWEGRKIRVPALVDTGNHLREPLTGRPVSIMDGATAGKLLGPCWEEQRGCFLIPYHSIGTELGWLMGVALDTMQVEDREKNVEIQKPVLAIWEGRVSAAQEYHIILHPLHADARRGKGAAGRRRKRGESVNTGFGPPEALAAEDHGKKTEKIQSPK